MTSSSKGDPFLFGSFGSNLTGQLITACSWSMYCSPLRCCVNKHLIVRTDLAAWFQHKQQQEQQQAVGSVEYRRYLWDVFATAEKRVYALEKGQSKLLGCKVPAIRLDKQWESRLGGFEGMSVEMWEDVMASLWSCFKGHYLLLPAEQALEYLMDKQQQRQQQQARESSRSREGERSSSSSSEDDGEPSAEDFARATRIAAEAAAAADKAEKSGESCELPSLVKSGLQYTSRFDVGCLWLFHRPLATPTGRGHDSLKAGVGKGLEGSVGSAAGSSSASNSAGVAGEKGTAAAAEGGPDASETAGEQARGVSVTQLRLMVNVLLLLWPCQKSPGERGSGAVAAALGKEVAQKLMQRFLEAHCWSWLLLLAALLQQAPAEAKQQLMKEYGTLLLQLLYRVLLDHEDMGGEDVEKAQLQLTIDDLGDVLEGVDGVWDPQERVCNVPWNAAPMTVVQLVLMVLQGLVFVADGGTLLDAGDVLDTGMAMVLREGKPCFECAHAFPATSNTSLHLARFEGMYWKVSLDCMHAFPVSSNT